MTGIQLKATKAERNGRLFILHCEHPHLALVDQYAVELPAHLLKQLVGQLIQEEGVNEQRSQSAVVAVTGPGVQ
jgi:hypothetical protein